MKLASLKSGRDGKLVVVSRDLSRCLPVPAVAATLQAALDDWHKAEKGLDEAFQKLERDASLGQPFDPLLCTAPLPRAYQWADGSAYVTHVELVRKARGVEMPPSFWTDPLMYQGGSDSLIGPSDPIEILDPAFGYDLEGEVAIVTGDVPMGVAAREAVRHIRLVMLANDVSLRMLIPGELAKGFGFFQSKPATAFSPVAVTPDELGAAWKDAKVHLPLVCQVNGREIGRPHAGTDMVFSFADLIAHAARTRHLAAGTIIGSGTVSNAGNKTGSACIAEIRMLEQIAHGAPATPFLAPGDRVRIDMPGANGRSIFGAIDQRAELCMSTEKQAAGGVGR